MVTASDVKNIDDMLLVPAGCQISARHIKILRTWGVSEVNVVDAGEGEDSMDPVSRLRAEQAARLESEMAALFHGRQADNSVMAELYRLAHRRRASEMLLEKT